MRSPSNNPSSRIAMCSEECAEVLAKVRARKPVNDGLNVKFDKHCSTEISCHDPYLLSSVADKSAVQEEMGKTFGISRCHSVLLEIFPKTTRCYLRILSSLSVLLMKSGHLEISRCLQRSLYPLQRTAGVRSKT